LLLTLLSVAVSFVVVVVFDVFFRDEGAREKSMFFSISCTHDAHPTGLFI